LDHVYHHTADGEEARETFQELAGEAMQFIGACGGTIAVARRMMDIRLMEEELKVLKAERRKMVEEKEAAKAKQRAYYEKRKETKAKSPAQQAYDETTAAQRKRLEEIREVSRPRS
jgi:hypothetical protein